MDELTAIVILICVMFSWIPILSICKGISWIISAFFPEYINVDEDEGISGWYLATGQRWEYKYISNPYSFLGRDWCVKLRFGWKITGKDFGELATFCFTPNPICPYTKK